MRALIIVIALILGLFIFSAAPAYAAGQTDPAISMSPVMFSLILFFVTTIIGIVAVLGGTGGGVLFTPLMMGFTPLDSYIIRATGLFVALSGSLIAARPFLRSGLANIKLLLFAAVPYTIFAIVGAQLAGYIDSTMGSSGKGIVTLTLGCLVVLIALIVVFSGKRVEYPEVKKADRFSEKLALGGVYWEKSLHKVVNYKISRIPVGIVLFGLVGIISGLFGLGAGWAMVPVLNLAMLAPLKIAAASSKVLIGIGDTGAIVPYFVNGGVFPLFVIPSVAGVVAGTAIGARIMPFIKASFIRWLVVLVLIAAGGKLVYDGIRIFI